MTLPQPTGDAAVSTLTIEIPVTRPRTFLPERYAHRRSGSPPRPAFRLETVSVTLYYPTSKDPLPSTSKHTWLPAPRSSSLAGLLRYAGFNHGAWSYAAILPAWALGLWRTKLPTRQPGPLATNTSSVPLPTAIFSPGLAGTPSTYSVYCSRLASHGIVVAALDHRDMTSPASFVHSSRGGKMEEVVYTKETDLTEDEQAGPQWLYRRTQLAFRRAEVYEASLLLQRLNAGEGAAILEASTRKDTVKDIQDAQLPLWKGRLDLTSTDGKATSRLLGVGHSFGAATILSCINPALAPVPELEPQEPSSESLPDFSVGMLLDPWVQPLAEDVPLPASPSKPPPIFVVNSQGFTLWSAEFARVKKLCSTFASACAVTPDGRKGWLTTLTGTQHTDFSDFPFLLPRFFAKTKKEQENDTEEGEGAKDLVEALPQPSAVSKTSGYMDVFEALSLRVLLDGNRDDGLRVRWEGKDVKLKRETRGGLLLRHALREEDMVGAEAGAGL
ncbi:hypothetical protein BDZ90DRAFT_229875 [Jaminaea rosea]|uniref:Putative phospholipase n=1 Tax=Jaminaea rosea TaxID=1569628 RepID=A0A316V1L0_9BASI|nr:hypothetical protein BDZ90DRAFT_229875 [Jaminaea rosea]PWN30888.1 hypothetical protein BDZ90DRAFT_229875 [Jaminaea rosea]